MNTNALGLKHRLAKWCCAVFAALMVLGLIAGNPLLVQPVAAAPTVSAANTQLGWEATSPQGASVTLDGTATSDDATQFQWWIACTTTPPCASGTLLGTTEVLQVTLPIGLSPITLWAAGPDNQWAQAPLITVVVNATPPVANAGPDNSYAATSPQGASVALNGSGSIGAASYSWSANGVEIATGATPTVTLPIATTKVTLTVASVAGLFATDDVNITVAPSLPDSDAGDDQTVASPNGNPVAVTLDGSGSVNAASYTWDLPGALPNATGVSPTVNLPVGNHTITLTVTSVSGNTDSDTVGVNVTGPPPPLNADAGPDRTAYMTNGTTATVPMDGTNSTGAVSYSWQVVGSVAPVFTGATPTFLLTQGVHTIRLTITGIDGATDTDDAVITVLPEPPLSADAGPDQTVVATNGTNAQVQLDGSGSNGAVSYAWNLPGALPDATGQKPLVTLPIGSFSITLTTTSASGATRIDTVSITVQKPLPSSSVSASQGPVGTVLNYSFIGFPSNTQVNIFFVGGGASIQATQINSNASGVGSGSLVVPTMVGGAKEVRFVVAGSIVSLSGFTITPRFRLTPATVERGGAVTMSVTGFRANEPIRIRWRIDGIFQQVGSGSTNASGTASGVIPVPAGANLGVNTVRVDGTVSSAQTSGISVVAPAKPAATISPDRGIVNTEVAYSVVNFPPLATVNIALHKPAGGSVVLGSVATNSSGAGSGSFVVPATPGGAGQTIRFSSGTAVAEASFEVVPRIRVSPGNAGGQTGVSLRGFGKGEVVNIRWLVGGTYRTVGTATMSNTGSANLNVPIPSNAAIGNNSVRAEGQTFSAQTNAAAVSPGIPPAPEPQVSVSPNRAIVGTTISYSIENYPASSTVDITFRKLAGTPLPLGSVQTNANGAASGTFVLPATPGGAGQAVRFTSGLVIDEATFEVAPRILVSAGTAGQPTGVSLRGFGKGEVVQIRWLVGGTYRTVGTATMSNSGSANLNVPIPADAAPGNNSVRGDGPLFRAQTNFASVTAAPPADEAKASVSPNRAIVGTVISYSIENHPATTTVRVALQRPSGIPLPLGSVQTDADGAASGTFVLPATPGGSGQEIMFIPERGTGVPPGGIGVVGVDFEVVPRILAGGGQAGGTSSISLRGFAAGEQVAIRWRVGDTWVPVGSATMSSTGSANFTVTIPANAAAGNNSVRADGPQFAAQTDFAVVSAPVAPE